MNQESVIAFVVILACSLLGLAVWNDVRKHRIPNLLVVGLLVVGMLYQILVNGSVGVLYAFAGIAVGLGFFIGFYIGGGMGAGDVKLMGAAGALLGPTGALLAGACCLVAGVFLVLGGAKALPLIQRYAASGVIPELFVQKNDAVRVPYAPAIFVGCVFAMWYSGVFSSLAEVIG